MLNLVVAVFLCAVLDRLRGSEVGPGKGVEQTLYGFAVAYSLLGLDATWWHYIAVAGAFIIGAAPGWGQPIGAFIGGIRTGEPEWWQFGKLKDKPALSLVVRGLIWGAPVALLTPFIPQAIGMLPVMAVAMIGGAWLGKLSGPDKVLFTAGSANVNGWLLHEIYRGALVGAGTWVLWYSSATGV